MVSNKIERSTYTILIWLAGVCGLKKIIVTGGQPLHGEVLLQGSKNSVLPMMAAAVLHQGRTILHNCPDIADVRVMIEILQSIGVQTAWCGNTLTMDCQRISENQIDSRYAGKMRSSIVLLGSMLGRTGKVTIGLPGGCVIGKRPIDLHIFALQQMGVRIRENENWIAAEAAEGLSGNTIHFPKVSVGATENALLAAVKANGITYLHNSSAEPEIFHLCCFLKTMGAKIEGLGTHLLKIIGVKELKDIEYWVPADRIVAGTYLFGAAITRGKIALHNPPIHEMKAVLRVYEKMGGQWEYNSGKLMADASGIQNPITYLETEEYPGFPTDLQSILVAVLLTIPGISCIKETVFEQRFQVIQDFISMGAKIQMCGKEVRIAGGYPLYGTCVDAQELRGGAALVLAGLAAKGETVIQNAHYIERGYQNIGYDLQKLGAKVYAEEQVIYEKTSFKDTIDRKW